MLLKCAFKFYILIESKPPDVSVLKKKKMESSRGLDKRKFTYQFDSAWAYFLIPLRSQLAKLTAIHACLE